MVRLNGIEHEYRPGMSLLELVGDHHLLRSKAATALDNCVVVLNGSALTTMQVREMNLTDNDSVYIAPILSGG